MLNTDVNAASQNLKGAYDPNGFDRFADSFKATMSDSITVDLAVSGKEFFRPDEEKTITGDMANQILGKSPDDAYAPDEKFSPDYIDTLIGFKESEEMTDINYELEGHSAGSFLGALSGGFATDPLVAVAGAGVGRLAATGIKAARVGTSLKNASKLLRSTKSFKGALKTELIENLLGTAVVDLPAMNYVRNKRHEEFEVREAATMIIGSTVLGTGLSMGIGKIKGDFKVDPEVSKSTANIESKFGDNTSEAIEIKQGIEQQAKAVNGKASPDFTEKYLDKKYTKRRPHQQVYEHVKTTIDNIKTKKFYTARVVGKDGVVEVSNNGIGSMTFVSDKNIAENAVQVGEQSGKMYEVDLSDKNLVDGNTLDDSVKGLFPEATGKIESVSDVIDKLADSGIDNPKEVVNQRLKKAGYDGYFKETTQGLDHTIDTVTIFDDRSIDFTKGNKKRLDTGDGISASSKTLNITGESDIKSLNDLPDTKKVLEDDLAATAQKEFEEMVDPFMNGQAVSTEANISKELPSTREQALDDNLESLAEDLADVDKANMTALDAVKDKIAEATKYCGINL